MFLLAFLQLLDFLLTWVGINKYKVIEEGNPLMVFLFKLNFISALFIRLFLISILMFFIYLIKIILYPIYLIIILFGCLVNLYILRIHYEWISILIKYGPMNDDISNIKED